MSAYCLLSRQTAQSRNGGIIQQMAPYNSNCRILSSTLKGSTEYCSTERFSKNEYSDAIMRSYSSDVEMKVNIYTQEILSQFLSSNRESFEDEQLFSLEQLKTRDFNYYINELCNYVASIDIKNEISNSEYFNNRSKIVIWIIESCRTLNFSNSTAIKAISCLDNLMIRSKEIELQTNSNFSCTYIKDDLEVLELYAIICIQIAMKFEEKELIHLIDMIEVLKCNVEILDIKLIEAHALQIINWDVSSNDSYCFLNFYLNIYICIFPIKENLCQFISNCTSLLNETIDNFEIYQFNCDIVALSIIWFCILNEYEQTDESEYLIKIAKRCLQYCTSEFFNCCIWISQQIQDKEELRSIIRPTLIEFLYFLSSDDSSDDELITLKFHNSVSERKCRANTTEKESPNNYQLYTSENQNFNSQILDVI